MDPYSILSVGPYPNSALSAGQIADFAVIPVLALAVWLIAVFAAAREPRHPRAAETTSLTQPSQAPGQQREAPEHQAA
jgi:hypothetical protein